MVFYKIAKINVIRYWKEVAKMSWLPLIAIGGCFMIKIYFPIITIGNLCIAIVIFSFIYLSICIIWNMNVEEKKIVASLIGRINDR